MPNIFEQTEYGLYARMALIMKMTGRDRKGAGAHPTGFSAPLLQPSALPTGKLTSPGPSGKSGDMLVCDFCDERTPLLS